LYSRFQQALAVTGARTQVAELYIRAKAGDAVLDVGCGPADILEYLPEVDYLGLDLSDKYLAAARRRFATQQPRARFVCMDVRALTEGEERFDLVLAQGLVHHLDDDHAEGLLKTVATLLKPGARLVTVDPTRTSGQPFIEDLISRVLVTSDRGRFIRSPHAYEELARRVFSRVQIHVRHDLMRLPYTHLFMECSEPRQVL
jgi:SAM-dependent methyltransferase